jgi:YVTN family beta-propeller protein
MLLLIYGSATTKARIVCFSKFMHMPERLFQLLFHIGQCFNTFCQTLVKFIESIGKPFSILKRHLRITNYTNTLTTWILVLVAAASLMDGITVYSESNNPSNSTRIVTTVPVGSRPHSIDFGLGKVFITNSGSDSVSVIDAKTDRVIATIPVGANPHGIAAVINDDENGNNTLDSNLLLKFPYMYVANTDSNTVSVIDAKTNKVVATIPVGANPHRLDLFMSTVYVTNSGSDSVSVKEAWNMSQIDDSMKSDKIKTLALAKECYAMKLELLTNATVVDDAIRFVASHAAPKITEKANSDKMVTVDEEVSNSSDIQGSEENRNIKQQSTTTTTNNSTF